MERLQIAICLEIYPGKKTVFVGSSVEECKFENAKDISKCVEKYLEEYYKEAIERKIEQNEEEIDLEKS